MNNISNDAFIPVNQPEYYQHFWDYLMGRDGHEVYLSAGQKLSAYELPTVSSSKFENKLMEESLFRQIGTSLYAPKGPSKIIAHVNTDSATWVEPGGEIPAYDGIDDFKDFGLNDHKLAVVLRMDDNFLHDAPYIFEAYVTDRLAKDFAHAEENGFVNGDGTNQPVGILNDNGGSEIGITESALSYDSIIKLFFSLDKDYRKNAVWLMNDATALALRTLKDSSGNYLWNGDMDNLLGKKIHISNYMPDAASGNKPVAFGDFSYYWVVDRNLTTIQILRERFIQTEQIGYLAQERLDGKLIRPDAIKTLKLAE